MSVCGVCEASTDGFLCRYCLGRLERDIGDFTSLLHEVSVLALGQARVYRTARRVEVDSEVADLDEEYAHRMAAIPARLRSRDGRMALPSTTLPVNLDARELLYDAYDTLLSWASSIGADEISSRHVVAWLLTHVNDVRFMEDAAQCYDELTYLHGRLERAVDRSPERIYAGPCETEGCKQTLPDGTEAATDLYAPFRPARADDEDPDGLNLKEFTCDGHRGNGVGCGKAYTWADRRYWLMASIDDYLVPLDTLRPCVKVLLGLTWPPDSTVRSWINRGRIKPRTIDRNGVELFRAGDVIALVRTWQPTRRTA